MLYHSPRSNSSKLVIIRNNIVGTYYEPGIVLFALPVLIHLILVTMHK